MDGEKMYIGRDLQEVHFPLKISDELFDCANNEIIMCLKKCKPKFKVFKEISARLSAVKPQICAPEGYQ